MGYRCAETLIDHLVPGVAEWGLGAAGGAPNWCLLPFTSQWIIFYMKIIFYLFHDIKKRSQLSDPLSAERPPRRIFLWKPLWGNHHSPGWSPEYNRKCKDPGQGRNSSWSVETHLHRQAREDGHTRPDTTFKRSLSVTCVEIWWWC